MKIEYLMIKDSNDFCATTDQLKSLLTSNKRLTIDSEQIFFSDVKFDYSLSANYVEWKKQKQIVFYLVLDTSDDNAEKLEELDILLHRINKTCGNQFVINTIWDDISTLYTKNLYPEIVLVENLLRKIIYRFMIKTAGSKWFESTAPEPVKKSIKNTVEKNQEGDLPAENQLYFADFIQLGLFFFEKYTEKKLDQKAISDLKAVKDDKDNIEDNLQDFFNTYEAKSNWDRYFARSIEVDDLYDKWNKLYSYRNKVAHSKRMRSHEYVQAKKLVDELSEAFNKCLEHIDDVTMTEEQAEAIQEVAKETISRPKFEELSTSRVSLSYPGLISGFSELAKSFSSITPQISIDGIRSGLLQLSNQYNIVNEDCYSTGDRCNLNNMSSRLYLDTINGTIRIGSDNSEPNTVGLNMLSSTKSKTEYADGDNNKPESVESINETVKHNKTDERKKEN